MSGERMAIDSCLLQLLKLCVTAGQGEMPGDGQIDRVAVDPCILRCSGWHFRSNALENVSLSLNIPILGSRGSKDMKRLTSGSGHYRLPSAASVTKLRAPTWTVPVLLPT